MSSYALSYPSCITKMSSLLAYGAHQSKNNLRRLHISKINNASTITISKAALGASPEAHGNGKAAAKNTNGPTQNKFSSPFHQGVAILDGVGYRQMFVVCSYEIDADSCATLPSIFNFLQETAFNHAWMCRLSGDEFCATHAMTKNNLIWVASRMQVKVDQYPKRGEILEIDTWIGASGKNGMRRDWEIRSHANGIIFARASSTWLTMNQKTRRFSEMPDEVRAEISRWFVKERTIKEDFLKKIEKLDDHAKYINSNLQVKMMDLDVNNRVKKTKYVEWMLEAIPDDFMKHHIISDIILEYKRECGNLDVVQSMCNIEEDEIIKHEVQHKENMDLINGCSNGSMGVLEGSIRYTHLLQMKGESKNEEIVRGKTTWKKRSHPPSLAS